jgi:MFS family permease
MLVVTFFAGIGFDVFGMGWNLAMQEHVPPEMLSRAYSYDALGSFVAMPIGQLLWGPLALWLGAGEVLVGSGIAYAVICALVLCSRSVRGLQRAPLTPTEPVTTATP